MIPQFTRFIEFVKSDRTLSEQSAEFIDALTRQVNQSTVQSGTGSPEGVITAEPTSLYMDDAGSTGAILYIKKTGAGNTGWIGV